MAALLVANLLVLSAGVARADPFADGVAAYNTGDYAAALAQWRPLAENGHVRAEFRLALMYDSGIGVTQDYREALKWFRLAADQGAADAAFNLGFIYDTGKGVPQDFFAAAKWYQIAADQGFAEAEF